MNRPRVLIALSLVVVLSAAALAGGADRRETPRPAGEPGRAVRVQLGLTDGGLATQGFAPGKPRGMAAMASWVEGEPLVQPEPPVPPVVDALFFDDEVLTIVASLFTTKTRDLKTTFTVTDESGNVVFDFQSGPVEAFPDQIDQWIVFVDTSPLATGFYRIAVRFKQGKKSVGTRYWIRVDQAPLGTAL